MVLTTIVKWMTTLDDYVAGQERVNRKRGVDSMTEGEGTLVHDVGQLTVSRGCGGPSSRRRVLPGLTSRMPVPVSVHASTSDGMPVLNQPGGVGVRVTIANSTCVAVPMGEGSPRVAENPSGMCRVPGAVGRSKAMSQKNVTRTGSRQGQSQRAPRHRRGVRTPGSTALPTPLSAERLEDSGAAPSHVPLRAYTGGSTDIPTGGQSSFPAPDRNVASSSRATPIPVRGAPLQYERFGSCTCICRHCNALFWYEERLSNSTRSSGPLYHRCCMGGKVRVSIPREYPPFIRQLFEDPHFLTNIRGYNQMFAMTSLGATTDDTVTTGRGPYVFKISGQIYHRIGRMCPVEGDDPRFLQLYIYDTDHEVDNRLLHFDRGAETVFRRTIVEGLIDFLDHNNALVQLFRMARDKLQVQDVPDFKVALYGVVGSSTHELPTADCIGAIVFEPGPEALSEFDVVIETHSSDPQRINKLHPCYMSLQFPLLFVYGEQGYHLDLKLHNVGNLQTDEVKKMSMNAYYSYLLHDRYNRYRLLARGGRLFQQYVVTAYCAIEQDRMDFVRKHQSDIRGEFLNALFDAVARGDHEGSDVGSRIILPASFTGGPRYMYSHYLDALAICRVHGNPTFFVTFTCNVRWPEIEEYMTQFPHLTAADRPDAIDRVFERKIHRLIKYIRDSRPLGTISAVLYTVEFQKRGLPHCHLLFWNDVSSKITNPSDVDRFITAELPDEYGDPEGFRIVTELMMHGPCGQAFPNATCMRE